MGLFKKKGIDKKEKYSKLPELPQLPELPEVSEFEKLKEEKLPQLPSFPNGELGNKFSQNTIKEAVTGEKEEEAQAEELEEVPMTPKPLVKETDEKEEYFKKREIKDSEPIFIRIDKFEESSKSFEEIKRKIVEIEKALKDVKQVKEDEGKELKSWEEGIIQIKEKLEKINENVFSKIR